MTAPPRWTAVAGKVVLWIGTVVVALGLGIAGLQKFMLAAHWQSLFAGWGYPAWLSAVVGVAEIGGALALLVPRFAAYAAIWLAAIMAVALGTLLRHPGGALGWGMTPSLYVLFLVAIAAARWQERAR